MKITREGGTNGGKIANHEMHVNWFLCSAFLLHFEHMNEIIIKQVTNIKSFYTF